WSVEANFEHMPGVISAVSGFAGGRGASPTYDQVVRGRTGHEVRLPATALEQDDVDAYAAALLGRPLTAPSAAQVALLKSRRVRATLEGLNLSQADLLEASLPSNIDLTSSVRWPHHGGGVNAEMELAGDVVNWLMLPLRRKLALKDYEAAKRRVSHEILDVVFEVKEAFYEVQAQQQFLHRLETAAEINGVTADIAQRLRKAGNISELELLQEQTNQQQATLDLRRTQGALATAREKLSRLLGLTSAESSRWRPAGNFPSMPGGEPASARAEAIAVAQRQDLAAQGEVVAALEMGDSLTRKLRLLPALNLGGNTESDTDGSRVSGPTMSVELPLFNWGQGRVRRSAAELAQARAAYEALELEVRSDVRTALAQLQAARTVRAQIAGNVLPQRQRILRETLLQYNAMQVSNFVLLRAKEDEVKAQHDLIEAQRDYWIARAHLEKAVGGSLNSPAQGKTSVGVHAH
ncbi:MAG: TolC family protein, partial [Prosthecobacter sp.]|nr:TolC family protein [Prosthecobacter sp.]